MEKESIKIFIDENGYPYIILEDEQPVYEKDPSRSSGSQRSKTFSDLQREREILFMPSILKELLDKFKLLGFFG